MFYDDSVVEQVRAANDIVDVVGRHVRLTKKGAYYFGLCPFHGEKTASFSVSPRKQIYYCFGCGAGGNVISFLMEYENYTFQEALKALADNAHIELPESSQKEDTGARELRTRLLEVNREAAIYYHGVLRTEEGRRGYEYLSARRKLSDRTITHFGLGFAGKSPDALYRYMKDKGYEDGLLKESGLFRYAEKGVRDYFWNRVMFPIMDTNSRVIGFGGRVMGDGEPKYLNSPETLIFDKSSTLYGLNFAKKSRSKYLLLCEGYMDVIALHQAGFTNAVASLGTAFTDKHARVLKRYTDNVILTQDSDSAGIRAKLRAYPILHEAGVSVRALDMGSYKDPDELICAEGPEGFEKCIAGAENAFLFMIRVLKDSHDLADPAEKTAFIRETADRLCMFRDSIERDNYIDSVSREFMIDRGDLKRLVDRMVENGSGGSVTRDIELNRRYEAESRRREAERQAAAGGDAGGPLPVRDGQEWPEGGTANQTAGSYAGLYGDRQASAAASEMLLASWIAERPGLAASVWTVLKPEDFTVRVYRLICTSASEAGERFDPAAFLDREDLNARERKLAAEAFARTDDADSIEGMDRTDIEKGLTEAVRAILSACVENEMAACGSDVVRFGELLRRKNGLKNIRVTVGE